MIGADCLHVSGGDTPEHVNQGLFDSVHKVKWSTDNKTLRIIGSDPSHPLYRVAAKALERITVNDRHRQ